MLAWTAFGNCEKFSQFAPSAMYLLANNADAKRAAIKISKSGQRVTKKLAKELIAEFSDNGDGKTLGEPADAVGIPSGTVEFPGNLDASSVLVICP